MKRKIVLFPQRRMLAWHIRLFHDYSYVIYVNVVFVVTG